MMMQKYKSLDSIKQHKSLSNEIRRQQIAEKLKSDHLNKILNTVGQDI